MFSTFWASVSCWNRHRPGRAGRAGSPLAGLPCPEQGRAQPAWWSAWAGSGGCARADWGQQVGVKGRACPWHWGSCGARSRGRTACPPWFGRLRPRTAALLACAPHPPPASPLRLEPFMPLKPGPDFSCLQLLPSNPHRGPTSSFRCLQRVWEFPKT